MSDEQTPRRPRSKRRAPTPPPPDTGRDAAPLSGEDPSVPAVIAQRQVLLDEAAEIVAVRADDDTIYLPLRQICDSLGLDYVGQMQRIRRDGVLGQGLRQMPVQTAGGRQAMQCFLLTYIPYWVSGIEVERIRPELQQRLRAYKEWVIARVYEAFAAETGMTPALTAGAGSADTALTLQQVEQLGLALTTLARQQLALEEHVVHEITDVRTQISAVDQRLDRAAEVMRDTIHEVAALKARLAPGQSITDEQAAEIAGMVKAIAHALTEQEVSAGTKRRTNAYSAVFSELYRRFGVTSYKLVKVENCPDVIAWLREYQQSLEIGTQDAGAAT